LLQENNKQSLLEYDGKDFKTKKKLSKKFQKIFQGKK